MIRVGVGHGLHDAHFGAQRAQQRRFLRRLVVGHHDHATVAARIAEMREADAGVARRAFDQRAAWREHAAAFGVVEDAAGGAILDRAAGIQELGLAENLAAGCLAGATQADQRRVADRGREAVAYFLAHGSEPSAVGQAFLAGIDVEALSANEAQQRHAELLRRSIARLDGAPTAQTTGMPAITAFCSSSKLARPLRNRIVSVGGNVPAQEARSRSACRRALWRPTSSRRPSSSPVRVKRAEACRPPVERNTCLLRLQALGQARRSAAASTVKPAGGDDRMRSGRQRFERGLAAHAATRRRVEVAFESLHVDFDAGDEFDTQGVGGDLGPCRSARFRRTLARFDCRMPSVNRNPAASS